MVQYRRHLAAYDEYIANGKTAGSRGTMATRSTARSPTSAPSSGCTSR
ncbi:MAG: hypothetical protein R3C32_04315 [Chloroflexota bacterium]